MRGAFVLIVFAACNPQRPECIPQSRSVSGIVTELAFTRFGSDPQIVDGFDLDTRRSKEADGASCNQPDYVAPDGTEGVDNQLASLLPLVDNLTGGALDGAVQSAVNNGQLLLAFTIDDVDDLCSDDQVTLRVQRVSGTPLVGADARLDPGQTFDLMPEEIETVLPATIKNRQVEIGPATIPFPVAILDAQLTVRFYSGRLRLMLAEDGSMEGLVGGGIDRDELMERVRGLTIRENLMTTIEGALGLFADLAPNDTGVCTQMSAAVRLSVRSAFVLR
jgi:hypothetical protein